MNINKKYVLPACLALFAIGMSALIAEKAWSEKQQQIDLVRNFYKDHLSRPDPRQPNQLPSGSFYSRELEALVDANTHLCESLSRGDEICGFGADTDAFLQAQEGAPGLNFEKSGFKAERSGDDTVDVFFNVYPEMGEAYARQLRYRLVKETAGWRVNDVLFSSGGSMRQEIKRENGAILASARELADAAAWVFHYLGNEDAIERAERFIAFPVQVCDEYGVCVAMKRDDARLRFALEALRSVYYGHDADAGVAPDLSFLPKAGQVPASEGKVATVGALAFTFQNTAWWITKIDLRRPAAITERR
jgi:hypothetical protein